ncbi:MAG: hypothetical protein QXF26_00645 [Candidatus Bathyarchaeia archaeon]
MCGAIVCLRLQYSKDVEKVADTMHINDEQALKLQELERGSYRFVAEDESGDTDKSSDIKCFL